MKRPVTNAIVALCREGGITYNPDTGVFVYLPERRWPPTIQDNKGQIPEYLARADLQAAFNDLAQGGEVDLFEELG